ncbi:MAG: MBL fold metallo-hydrolase [Candidatus Bathyarchaeota archaeon]|nr:MBL fold metallo-hydrolase [Candidatus Bathyarchaeota archaeon]MDH5687044.1 MBL fold metallo-hydrolase [Candidatus Bathyarchaeota archaeon]
MIEIIFLGTGGGRFAMITQQRRTGGIRILSDNSNIHLDPGPGALIYSLEAGLDPQKINAILVSHSHTDHVTDAQVLIEAMSRGTKSKRGLLAAAHSVLYGNEVCGQSISNYHQSIPEKVIDAQVGVKFSIGDLEVRTTRAEHSDPDAVGFRLVTADYGDFAYTSDSEYFGGIEDYYKGVRLLILCVLRPYGRPWKGHMTTEDAIKIAEKVRPEMTIITHFGMGMIFKARGEAQIIETKTGIPTKPATDGMHIYLAEEIQLGIPKKQRGLGEFLGRSEH